MEFKVYQKEVELQSRGWIPTFHDISKEVNEIVAASGIKNGTVAIVSHHTTCSVMVQECSHDIDSFDLDRYLGKWYEIARFDFTFERNLSQVTAEYSMNKDGSVKVVNRGFNYAKDDWQEAVGRARFRGNPTVGALEVSFFGPFYGGYNIIALDENYQYALVAGKDLNYLWILSRTPTMPSDILTEYLILAESLGFDIDNLVWTVHSNFFSVTSKF